MDSPDSSHGELQSPLRPFGSLPQREHLPHLANVFARNPLYFLTCCVAERRPIIANDAAAVLLVDALRASRRFHGWDVGRYVIMPDHIHFFARPSLGGKPLSGFMRDWKKWTATRVGGPTGNSAHLWQPEYFDHVVRSANSYTEKWEYVRNNPVRAGLVESPDMWPYWGECETLTF